VDFLEVQGKRLSVFGCEGGGGTWKASSLVWQMMTAATWPGTGSSCCRTDSTNTAVLPMPDLAWHSTSIPRMAWGMHWCCTAHARKETVSSGGCVQACLAGELQGMEFMFFKLKFQIACRMIYKCHCFSGGASRKSGRS